MIRSPWAEAKPDQAQRQCTKYRQGAQKFGSILHLLLATAQRPMIRTRGASRRPSTELTAFPILIRLGTTVP